MAEILIFRSLVAMAVAFAIGHLWGEILFRRTLRRIALEDAAAEAERTGWLRDDRKRRAELYQSRICP
ncbi:MAG: hypothetical protein ACRD2R_00115 [Terriglobales bacterium]